MSVGWSQEHTMYFDYMRVTNVPPQRATHKHTKDGMRRRQQLAPSPPSSSMITLSLLETESGDKHLACSGWRPAQCHRSTRQSADKSEHQIMLITCRRLRRSTRRCHRHGFYSCCSWRMWITDRTAAQ